MPIFKQVSNGAQGPLKMQITDNFLKSFTNLSIQIFIGFGFFELEFPRYPVTVNT